MARSAIITVMTRAAMKAAKGLRRDFGELENLQVSKKGTADFVSAADLRAEKIIHEELSYAREDYGFLMEETGEIKGKDATLRWVVDPLDGTSNFLHAVPYFCISIGLEKLHANGTREVLAGVVYDPLRDELFTAEKGKGAFLNDRRLRVTSRKEMEDSIIATGTPRAARSSCKQSLAMITSLSETSVGIRICGATALDLAYVAAGRYDGFWCLSFNAWDVVPGMLMVREAGGVVSEIGGGNAMLDKGNILATNGLLHEKVNALLGEIA